MNKKFSRTESTMKSIGERITKEMALSGVSQIQMSRELGIPRSTIWNIRKGRSISLETFVKICSYLKIKIL